MLDLTQLLRVPHVDTELRFDLSPNGEKVAFAWNGSGNWEIYEMSLRGAERPATSAPDRHILAEEGFAILSTRPGSKFSPQYSPNGTSLAYALDLDGSESYHIVLHDLVTGNSQDLTPDIGYAQQPNFAFSPDGKHIAVLSDQRGQFALYAVPSSGGKAKLLMDIQHPCWNACWSPDGERICVEAETIASDRGLFVVAVEGSDPVQIRENGRRINGQNAAWSPDGKVIAFSGENGDRHDIGLYEVETGRVKWLDPTEGDDDRPCWSSDGSLLSWIHSQGATTSLMLRERSSTLRSHQVGSGLHHHPRFTKDGEGVVCIYESPSQPPDLWRLCLEDGSFVQLTNSLPAELHNTRFIQPEEVRYPSDEGAMIPALLYRAPEGVSAVVNIHGGPNWLFQFMWHPLMSYMASRGWTVLAPNYRGSTGYGRKWQTASRFDMGGVDARDCAAAATYLVEIGLAGKNQVAVTGRSHGGYLTICCLTMFPELWAGGSAVVPFLNWLSSHHLSREDLQHWNIENMGDPEENRELWIEHSPYFFLDKINAPVQLICGANDPRCPASDSIAARDKLKELGREVEFLLYEDEGHTFLATDSLIDSEIKRVDFLARILQMNAQPQTDEHPREE